MERISCDTVPGDKTIDWEPYLHDTLTLSRNRISGAHSPNSYLTYKYAAAKQLLSVAYDLMGQQCCFDRLTGSECPVQRCCLCMLTVSETLTHVFCLHWRLRMSCYFWLAWQLNLELLQTHIMALLVCANWINIKNRCSAWI